MKYRKKPVVIEATQWYANGDHPEDDCKPIQPSDGSQPFLSEGKVVRYYRRPDDPGERLCNQCGARMHEHGWIDTRQSGHVVCPGDWIITLEDGENYPCKPDLFARTYELVEP